MRDAELLSRWAREKDAGAFDQLAERHADMVHGVARRVLGGGEADDVCQAVFVVLMRKARKLAKHPDLAGWLHLTAVNLARHAIRSGARRRRREEEAMQERKLASMPAGAGLRGELDAALAGLPERFRAPVVLVHLEGKSYAQAAERLGVPEGTVASRLNAGMDRLRRRLERVGCAVALAVLLDWLKGEAAQAAPANVKIGLSAMAASGGALLGAGAVSVNAVTIAEGAMRAVLWTKLRLIAGGVVAAGAIAASLALTGAGAGESTSKKQDLVALKPKDGEKAGAKPVAPNGPRILWSAGMKGVERAKLPEKVRKAQEKFDAVDGDGEPVGVTPAGDRVLLARGHSLVARDSATGKVLWSHREKSVVEAPSFAPEMRRPGRPGAPLVVDGQVFFGTNSGIVRRIDLADGRETASAVIPSEKSSLPLPKDAGPGTSKTTHVDFEKQGRRLAALLKAGAPSFSACPTLHAGKLYLISDKEMVYVLDADSLKLLWKRRTGPTVTGSSPRLAFSPDARIYFSTGSKRIYDMGDAPEGEKRSFAAPGSVNRGVLVAGDRLYFCATDLALDVRALFLRLVDDAIRKAKKSKDPVKIESAIAAKKRTELFAAVYERQLKAMGMEFNTKPGAKTTSYLCAFGRKTRKQLWRVSLGEEEMAVTGPRLVGDVVYCLTSRHLRAVTIAGKELWKVALENVRGNTGGFAVVDAKIYVACGTKLLCLSRESGSKLWDFELGARKPVGPATELKGKYSPDETAKLKAMMGLGKQELRELPPNGFVVAPRVYRGVVYVSTTAGSVYAILPPAARLPETTKTPSERF